MVALLAPNDCILWWGDEPENRLKPHQNIGLGVKNILARNQKHLLLYIIGKTKMSENYFFESLS